jgi:hypothetical protein
MQTETEVDGDEPAANDDAFQTRDLSSILNRRPVEDDPAPKDTGDKAEPNTSEPGPAQAAADPAKDAGKAKEATPASDDDGPSDWKSARQALKSVTERNKDLERQIRDLTSKVMTPAQAEKDKPQRPDPIVDPDGYEQHVRENLFREQVEDARADMIDEVGKDKFEAAEAAFKQAMLSDREFAERIRSERLTATRLPKIAYREGTKLLESRPDPVRDRERLEAEITAKVMEKLGLKPDGTTVEAKAPQQPKRAVTPTSLADARSAGPSTGPAWDGPRPLSSLIGPRRN